MRRTARPSKSPCRPLRGGRSCIASSSPRCSRSRLPPPWPAKRGPPRRCRSPTSIGKTSTSTGTGVSEKLDGVRAYWDGERLRSRKGNRINAPPWFVAHFPRVAARRRAVDGARRLRTPVRGGSAAKPRRRAVARDSVHGVRPAVEPGDLRSPLAAPAGDVRDHRLSLRRAGRAVPGRGPRRADWRGSIVCGRRRRARG